MLVSQVASERVSIGNEVGAGRVRRTPFSRQEVFAHFGIEVRGSIAVEVLAAVSPSIDLRCVIVGSLVVCGAY